MGRLFAARERALAEIKLALDTAAGEGLRPQDLDTMLTLTVRKLTPVVGLLQVRQAGSMIHQFNRITSVGKASAAGQRTTPVVSDSVYAPDQVQVKILQKRLGVTGLLQASNKARFDMKKQEIANSVLSMSYLSEFEHLWGHTGDAFYYQGFEDSIVTHKTEKAGAAALVDLDNMIDRLKNRGVVGDPLHFVMSPNMLTRMSGLQSQTNILIDTIEIEGTWRFKSYRGIPIVESSYCRPDGSVVGTFAAADGGAGGLLDDDGVYRYKIAALTYRGESIASAEATIDLAPGSTSVDLSWAAYTDADGNPAEMYRIYRTVGGGIADSETYLATIPARTYDVDGNPTGNVTTYTDNAADATLSAARTPMISVGGNPEETVFLINRSPEFGSYTTALSDEDGEQLESWIRLVEIARTRDLDEAFLKAYMALVNRAEMHHAVTRRIRVA